MSMYNTISSPPRILAKGCIVSDTLTETARVRQQQEVEVRQQKESEEQRIQKAAQAIAQDAIAREREKMRAEEARRREALETAWNKTIETLKAEIQHQVIEMSIQISEIILQHALPDRRMMQAILEETLAPVSDLQGLRVRLNPDDYACQDIKDSLSAHRSAAIEWVPDPALKRGDVVVESRNGIFDARLKERLAVLRDAIANPSPYVACGNIATGEQE